MRRSRLLSIVVVSATLVLPGARAASAQTSNAPPVQTPDGPSAEQTGFTVGVGAGGAPYRVPEGSIRGTSGLSRSPSFFVTGIAGEGSRATLESRDWSVGRESGMDAGYESKPHWSMRQATQAGRTRSIRRKILGGVVGAIGGFFGGMFLGASIEGDRCECDDPGLVGALIGAPVGAAAGGILGYKFLF